MKISEAALQRRTFFHRIQFDDGSYTDGISDPRYTLDTLQFPADASGMELADIGCADWGLSIEMLRRGAKAISALDIFDYPGHHVLRREHPELVPADRFTFRQGSVEDESLFRESWNVDAVVFSGVLYHLVSPYLAILNIARIMTPGTKLYLETHGMNDAPDAPPRMEFIQPLLLNGDPTNIWSPSESCVIAMLQQAGFMDVSCIDRRPMRYADRIEHMRFFFHATR